MVDDFPAAHSMDTEWFAVDAKGHVGLFQTGEGGMMPLGAGGGPGEVGQLAELLRGRPLSDEDFEDYDAVLEEQARSGVFVFDYLEGWLELYYPYALQHRPEKPLHVDELPPAVRKRVKAVRLASADFSSAEYVQPLGDVECDFWWSEGVAYIAADGKTVKPMPGREAEFADFCRNLRKRDPKETKGLIFEGVEDEPPAKPKPKPRRKKKGR
jgi:hypothetical protein